MPIETRQSRRAQRHRPYDHGEPLKWLNLVPLAGIMGIAGALIASSYGITPNAVTVPFPDPMPVDEMGPLTPNVNRLVVTADGSMLWNGVHVSEQELGAILDSPQRERDGAALLFTPDEKVTYARALEVLALLRRHGAIDRCFRFSGIQQYRDYDDPATFNDLIPATREDCPPLPPEHAMPSIRR